jgi:hypothetical protein
VSRFPTTRGSVVSLFFAYLVARMQGKYYYEIMLPGAIVGLPTGDQEVEVTKYYDDLSQYNMSTLYVWVLLLYGQPIRHYSLKGEKICPRKFCKSI